jgi:hypothetical protein
MSNGSNLTNETYEEYKALWAEVDSILNDLKQDTSHTAQVVELEGKLMDIDLFLKKLIVCFWTNAPISLTDGAVHGSTGGNGAASKCPGTSAVAQ